MSAKTQALEAVVERIQGGQVSRLKAALVAVGAGVVVYRLLRSGEEEQANGAGEGEEDASAAESSETD